MKKFILVIILVLTLTRPSIADVNRGYYNLGELLEYRIHKLMISIDSKILAKILYKRILYWQNQEKPEPVISELPFENRG